MASITTSDIRAYIAKRQSDPFVVRRARRVALPNGRIVDVPVVTRHTSNGEINRELTTLKRMFSLAILRELLETLETETKKLAPKKSIIPFVFHRNGRRVTKFPKSWRDACVAAAALVAFLTISVEPRFVTSSEPASRKASR